MRKFCMCVVVLFSFVAIVDAHGKHGKRGNNCTSCGSALSCSQPNDQSQQSTSEMLPPSSSIIEGANASGTMQSWCQDALSEVNNTRATRGLRPFQADEQLREAAFSCAKQRASRGISGHLPESDFHYLHGSATAAGCAAWTPDWGWGACCTYENYTYAGAAWVLGSDGRRYMHIFVR